MKYNEVQEGDKVAAIQYGVYNRTYCHGVVESKTKTRVRVLLGRATGPTEFTQDRRGQLVEYGRANSMYHQELVPVNDPQLREIDLHQDRRIALDAARKAGEALRRNNAGLEEVDAAIAALQKYRALLLTE